MQLKQKVCLAVTRCFDESFFHFNFKRKITRENLVYHTFLSFVFFLKQSTTYYLKIRPLHEIPPKKLDNLLMGA